MEKKFLSIECSSELCSVALYDGKSVSSLSKQAAREHAYLVLPFAQELLSEAGIEFSELDEIYFGRGPGAFTGLRVAAGIAQGLALAHSIELKSFCSLASLALSAKQLFSLSSGQSVYAVLDARMGELYWSSYVYQEGELVATGLPSLGSANQLVASVASPAYFIGPGCRHLLSKLSEIDCINVNSLKSDSEVFPHAKHTLTQVLHGDVFFGVEAHVPLYLRNNVAAKARDV